VRVGATEEKRKEQVQVAERRHVVEARLRPVCVAVIVREL